MPSFFSGAPKVTPSSDFSTTNAEMPATALLGVGHREHGVVLRDARVGDPALHAVEDVAVAVAYGAGLHAHGVRAGVRLRQAVGEATLAARQRAEVLLLELLRARDLHRQRAQLVDRRDQAGRRARAGDLLDDEHGGERVGAGAAVLLRHVGCVEVRGQQRVGRLLRVAGVLVDVRGVRRDLGVADGPNGLADRLVLLGEGIEREVGAHGADSSFGQPPGRREVRPGGRRVIATW